MNILLLGGSGFIGRHLAARLRARGHQLQTPTHKELDLRALDERAARACLRGQDAVVNAVGIMSRDADRLETVHHHAPATLAAWAREAGVARWLQVSALGADAWHPVAFLGSKGRGDEAVRAQLATDIVRPSVVYGRGGKSCELFIRLARLPLFALPEGGRQMLQPVHVYDVADGVAALLAASSRNATLNMSGGRALSLAAYLNTLRATLHGKTAARVLPLPSPLLAPFLPLTNYLSDGMVSAATLRLLADGSCADNRDFTALLGRLPLAPEQFAAADVAGF